jgi:outer membrane protein OmpA-like peptidoglycan-associated protein
MMKPQSAFIAAAFAVAFGLPFGAAAQTACPDVLAKLQPITTADQVPALLAAWKEIEASSCDPRQILAARSQASAFIATVAQEELDKGDAAGAEALIKQVPGVHWAVQALRGDLAAKRGDRAEAARMYNAAIDTLGDPQQTVQNAALEPAAEQLASLAQENMMLAGSMESSVTRGGGASGVMKMAARGLSVEKVNAEHAAAPAADPAYQAPAADPAYQAPAVDPAYQAPAADPAYQAPAADPAYQAPAADPAYQAPADPAYQAPAADPAYQAPAADPAYQAPADPAYQAPAPAYNVVQAAAANLTSVFLPIRFGFDSDRLDAAGTKEALRLSDFIKANNVGSLIITGHTDDVGDANYNLDLSARRARSLADFLLSDGVHSRITIIGKGESEPPLYTDAKAYSLDELRTIARRVEVAFGY